MPRIHSALSVMMALVSPFALAVSGAAVAIVLTYGGDAGPDNRARPAREGRAIVSDDGGTVHITLDVAEADASTNLLVHGADGRELATFHIHRDGAFTLVPTASDPVRFIVHRNTTGSVEMGVHSVRAGFVLHAWPDGSADLLVNDAVRNPMYGVRVTAEGVVLPHEDVPAL